MYSEPTDQLTLVFGALTDPTRRAILARLAEGDATVNELVAPFGLSQPTISKHLKVLERAGLVSRGRVEVHGATPLAGSAITAASGTRASTSSMPTYRN